MSSNQFKIIAKTLHGLEPVLAKEIEALGTRTLEIGRRMVAFEGDKAMLYKANFRLRTALRLLKPIYTFKAKTADELYETLLGFDWSSIMTSKQTFAIDTVVYSDLFQHSQFVAYRTKDALVDFFVEKEGVRPSVRLDNPDIYLNLHIAHNEVTLSLDSSGESLHKRGYRVLQTDAPINEVLAAGILLQAGWDGQSDLLDPMCGSGTFLIEAALIARNIPVGIYRSGYAFQNWLDYDEDLFAQIYEDDSEERPFNHKIYGSDILRQAILISERNIARAGVSRDIQLDTMPFAKRPKPEKPTLIVMNPPYGERLGLNNADELYAMIGERLKHNYSGCKAWIIAYRSEHFNSIGLRHNIRTSLMNGALECELRAYELFDGKREEYKRNDGKSFQDRAKEYQGRERVQSNEREHSREKRSFPREEGRTQKVGGFRRRNDDRRQSNKREERKEFFTSRQDGRQNKGSFKPRRIENREERRFQEREERGSFRPRQGDNSEHKERIPRQKNLWPQDRFRREDGTIRPRASRNTAFQVDKSSNREEESN